MKTRHNRLAIWSARAGLALLMAVTPGRGQEDPAPNECGTMERWQQSGGGQSTESSAFCPTLGSCDSPTTRDQSIPTSSTPLTFISLQINVLCDDAGLNCRADLNKVQAALNALTADFSGVGVGSIDTRLRFIHRIRFINDSRYLTLVNLALPNPDDFPMKDAYATDPAHLLNVWVTNITPAGLRGLSTFPWDSLALAPRGGILVDEGDFGVFGSHTFTHEVGHALGLWHPHRGGSTEVTQCGGCWESPHQTFGNPQASLVGDYCEDTAATDPNFTCLRPTNNDPCTGFQWGFLASNPSNFMGFSPLPENNCRNNFTRQQAGRLRCWFGRVSGWTTVQQDSCSTATTIAAGTYFGTTRGFTAGGVASVCDFGQSMVDVWYAFVPTRTGPVTVSLCGTGTSFDSEVSVHTSCTNPQNNEVACSSSYPGCGKFGAQGRLTFNGTVGVRYLIRVTNDSGGPGDYELLVCEGASAQCDPPGPKPKQNPTPPSPGGSVTL